MVAYHPPPFVTGVLFRAQGKKKRKRKKKKKKGKKKRKRAHWQNLKLETAPHVQTGRHTRAVTGDTDTHTHTHTHMARGQNW